MLLTGSRSEAFLFAVINRKNDTGFAAVLFGFEGSDLFLDFVCLTHGGTGFGANRGCLPDGNSRIRDLSLQCIAPLHQRAHELVRRLWIGQMLAEPRPDTLQQFPDFLLCGILNCLS